MALGYLGLVADIVAPQGVDGDGLPDRLDRGNRALLEAIFSFASSGGEDFREYAASHVRRAVHAEPPDPSPWAVQQGAFPVA
jgi:DNA-directed RNA polymerase specialized sigma subunit